MTLTEQYKALSDLNRLRILRILENGSFNVGEITAILDGTQSNISHHLKVLNRSGLIKVSKQGTWAYYSLSDSSTNPTGEILTRSFLEASKRSRNGESPLFERDDQEITAILNQRRENSRVFFDSVAKRWGDMREEVAPTDSYLEALKAEVREGTDLVELGCGAGHLLSKLTPRKGSTIGVDNSSRMLEEAGELLAKSNVELRLGNLEHLPLADACADTALCHMVLHHISDPIVALRDAARVLRSGGKLVVVDLVKHDREEMRERHSDLWLGFDLSEFSSWVESTGFCAIATRRFSNDLDLFLLTAHKGKKR